MFMRYIFLLCIFCATSAFAGTLGIVAIVNDRPIAIQELYNRKEMTKSLNDIPHLNSEQEKLFTENILNELIDEQLLSEQADQFKWKISDVELSKAIAEIESRNKMKPGQMISMLNSKHVNIQSFKDKIRSEIIKSRILSEVLSRDNTVSKGDVEYAVLRGHSKDAELRLKVITTTDKSKQSYNKMLSMKQKIKGCSDNISKIVGSSATVSDMDVVLSKVDTQVRNVIKDMQIGDISDVIKTGETLSIFVLCSKKLLNFSDDENQYVVNFLSNKKLLLKARKYQNDLRKKAYIRVMI